MGNNSRVDVKNLPEALTKVKDALFISDTDMAARMGISYTAFWKIMNKETKTVRRSTIRNLCESTGYTFTIDDNKIEFYKATKVELRSIGTDQEIQKEIVENIKSLDSDSLQIVLILTRKLSGQNEH